MEKTTTKTATKTGADEKMISENRDIVVAVKGLFDGFDKLDDTLTAYLRTFVRNVWKIRNFQESKVLVSSLMEAITHINKKGLRDAVSKWLYRMGISQSKSGSVRINLIAKDWDDNEREKYLVTNGTVFSLISIKKAYEDFVIPDTLTLCIGKIIRDTGVRKAQNILKKLRNSDDADLIKKDLDRWEAAIAEVKHRMPELEEYEKAEEAANK